MIVYESAVLTYVIPSYAALPTYESATINYVIPSFLNRPVYETATIYYVAAPAIDSKSVEISFSGVKETLYAFGKSGNYITPSVSSEYIKLVPQ